MTLWKKCKGFWFPQNQMVFLWRWMGFSLFFHLLTGWLSVGYQAADEHFQILEFLSYKLGGAPAHDLPVEFREQMRPWLQVQIYWALTQIMQFVGITNPHQWVAGFRIFTGLLGWLSTVGLAFCSLQWFKDKNVQRTAILLLALIWYFPVLHVRPSSESLGGTAFALAITTLVLYGKRSLVAWGVGGMLFGLSFESRFQMGFMIAGAAAWYLIIGRLSARQALAGIAGFIGVFALGRCADFWGYGQWTLSPWNYVDYNLVRGEVSRYGQAPWWDVFRMSITESWPILGLIVAVGSVLAWVRHPTHLLTWSVVPFFLIHELIAHKELRFFFPIASLSPVLLILAVVSQKTAKFAEIPSQLKKALWFRIGSGLILSLLILNNSVGLLAMIAVPLARSIQFQEAVHNYISPGSKEFHLYTQDRDPFIILGNPTYFFRPEGLQVHRFRDVAELQQVQTRPFWLFEGSFELPEEARRALPYCHLVFRTVPKWTTYLNWNNWLNRTHVWSLYRCD